MGEDGGVCESEATEEGEGAGVGTDREGRGRARQQRRVRQCGRGGCVSEEGSGTAEGRSLRIF